MNKKIFLILITLLFGTSINSFANVDLLKYYREVNPALKADCTYCHLDKLPKKEDGKHELNAYGLELKKQSESQIIKDMTKDQLKEVYLKVLKQLGRHDEFKPTENTTEEKK